MPDDHQPSRFTEAEREQLLHRIAEQLRALPASLAADHRTAADMGILAWSAEQNRDVRVDPAEMLKQKDGRLIHLKTPLPMPIDGLPPEKWPVRDSMWVEEPRWQPHEIEKLANIEKQEEYIAEAGRLLCKAMELGALLEHSDLCESIGTLRGAYHGKTASNGYCNEFVGVFDLAAAWLEQRGCEKRTSGGKLVIRVDGVCGHPVAHVRFDQYCKELADLIDAEPGATALPAVTASTEPQTKGTDGLRPIVFCRRAWTFATTHPFWSVVAATVIGDAIISTFTPLGSLLVKLAKSVWNLIVQFRS